MTDSPTPTEPAQVDWEAKYNELKAESRKWEERSKTNHSELQTAQSSLEQALADLESTKTRIGELETANTDLTEKVTGFEQEKELSQLKDKIGDELKVPAAALRGSTEDELRDHAAVLAASFKSSGPVVRTAGNRPADPKPDEGTEAVRQLFGNS